jgi:CDP-4-dehydro-6-deoxyglucose reductase, E1
MELRLTVIDNQLEKFMTSIKFPLALQTINNSDIDSLIEWLKTYPQLTKGKVTLEFEEKWAQYIGTRYAVFCNSGSSANLLAFYAMTLMGLKNKKVVVPSVGWVTTISPVIQLGYEPIMIDADPDTFGIDLDQLEEVCEKENPALVIFVQVLGVPHDYKRLLQLQEKYGFELLEDACAALGSEYYKSSNKIAELENGDKVNSFTSLKMKVGMIGDASTFSFYFGHQLSTIEGGMVCTNDASLYDMMLMLRSHGWGKDLSPEIYNGMIDHYGIDDFAKPFTFFVPGLNLRATDLQAFLGLRQLEKADWVAQRRYENHVHYADNLDGIVDFQIFGSNKPASISFGALAQDTEHRRRIVQALMDSGIETRMFSAGNLGLHPFWTELYGEFHGVVADRIHACGFFVPNFPELQLSDIDFICDVIKSA